MPVSVKEKELGGQTYRFDPLGAYQAGHILRRLAPVVGAGGASIQSLQALGVATLNDVLDKPGSVEAFGPLLKAFAQMADADVDYVMNSCLDAVKRRVAEGAWQKVRAPGGGFMFADIDLPLLYALVGHVLAENFGGFFDALGSLVTGADSPPT